MAESNYDLVIVGGGPGGYVAAVRAAQLGLKTVVVESKHLGGICLNWGCIPTKALLRCSEINHLLHNLDMYGFSADNISFDIARVVKRSRSVAGQLSGGVKHLLKKNKVDVVDGWGRLTGKPGTVAVEQDGMIVAELKAKHVILATGARARSLPGLEADGKRIWTYTEAMVPEALPASLLVVGSGAIGVEFASFYRNLGSEVTVVEVLDRILPVEDEEISKLAAKSFEKQGMTLITSAQVKTLKSGSKGVTATIESSSESGGKSTDLTVERVIMAVGIVGNVENIGIEETKVQVERGHITINEWCETGEPGVYAIGDVAGPPWLAHKASHEGVICVEKIAGVNGVHPLDTTNIPGCTYCQPQIASVGLTEKAAKDAGRKVRVGRFPFAGNGKAVAMGDTEGMVKTVFDADTGELLGAHMIGAEVTEMIQGYGIAKTLETTESELLQTIFAHPTISETMHESVLNAYGRAIHY
jgi:dihydrolipoamide dehydrogenase